MSYCFRLTFYCQKAGLFRFDSAYEAFTLGDGLLMTVSARDADSLVQASRYHVQACGFPNEAEARLVGERLRLHLRFLNAILALGISVPTSDTTSARLSTAFKEKLEASHDAVIMDSIVGLATFPDDNRHLEFVVAAKAEVYPSKQTYLFDALSNIWPIEMQIDENSEISLEILNHAVNETSMRSQFLLTYLALEQVVERRARGGKALTIIEELERHVRATDLDPRERNSLAGSVAALRERSFSSALSELGQRISTTERYCEMPIDKFFSACISTRNRIAHIAGCSYEIDLGKMSRALIKIVLILIWTRNSLTQLNIDIPNSLFTIPEDGYKIRVI